MAVMARMSGVGSMPRKRDCMRELVVLSVSIAVGSLLPLIWLVGSTLQFCWIIFSASTISSWYGWPLEYKGDTGTTWKDDVRWWACIEPLVVKEKANAPKRCVRSAVLERRTHISKMNALFLNDFVQILVAIRLFIFFLSTGALRCYLWAVRWRGFADTSITALQFTPELRGLCCKLTASIAWLWCYVCLVDGRWCSFWGVY